MARPKKLDDALKLEICERIADGETVREIAADEHMAAARTIYSALASDEAFAQTYARAREAQLVRWEDELLEIADDATNDFVSRKRGDEDVEAVDHDHIARSKLRIDTRKWLMSKRLPRKYGDRVATEVSGPDGGPIETREVSDDQRARAVAFLFAKNAAGQKPASEPSEG